MPVWNNDGPDDPPVIDSCESFAGGQVSYARPSLLQPNQAALLHDCVTPIVGELMSRKGTRDIPQPENTDAIGARGLVLSGSSEFAYKGDTVLLDLAGQSFNAIYEERVLQRPPTSPYIQTDIVVTLDRMADRYPDLQDVWLVLRWFYPSDFATGPVPCISQEVKDQVVSADDWGVDGLNADTATVLSSDQGGTPSDDSVVWIFNELKARGYKVGILCLPVEDSNTPAWRGGIDWTTHDLTAWSVDYDHFVRHYVDLLNGVAANIRADATAVTADSTLITADFFNSANGRPDYFLLGSQLQSATRHDAPTFPFIEDVLKPLADYVRSVFLDEVQIGYAAAPAEFGHFVAGAEILYPLDALWAYENVDFVGIDYFFPLSQAGNGISAEAVTDGMTSGPDWDFTRDTPNPSQGGRTLNTSKKDDSGFSNVGTTALTEHFRQKDVVSWREWLHFEVLSDRATVARSYPGRIQATMEGGLTMGSSVAVAVPGGQWDAATMPETFLELDDSKWAEIVIPDVGNTYAIECDIKIDAAAGVNPVTLFKIAGVVEIRLNTGSGHIQSIIETAGGTTTTVGQVYAFEDRGKYRIQIDATTGEYVEKWNGAVIGTAALAGVPDNLVGTAFLNSNDGTGWFGVGSFFSLSIEAEDFAEFWSFSDGTVGTRTLWESNMKPAYFTQVGIASISSSTVEPIIEPAWDVTPANPTGPFNSSFLQDLGVQDTALRAMLLEFADSIALGDIEGYSVYQLDARPWEAIVYATEGDQYFYKDRLSFFYSHALNGKPADGWSGSGVAFALTQSIQAITWYATPQTQKLVAFSGGRAFSLEAYGWQPYFTPPLLAADVQIDVVQLTDKLYFTGATNGLLYKWNGTALSQVVDGPQGATILKRLGTRLVAAGYTATPDAVDFSDLLNGDEWDFTNQRLLIGNGDGDPVVSLAPWIQRNLFIIKGLTSWLVTADPSLDVSAFPVQLVHSAVGGVAKNAWAQVGQDIWFLSKYGVQSLQNQLATSNQQITLPVSQPIQDVIEDVEWSAAGKSVAMFWNNFFLLSVPVDNQSPDKILAYNYLTGAWTIFRNWNAICFCEQPFAGRSRVVFGRPDGSIREWLEYDSTSDHYFDGSETEADVLRSDTFTLPLNVFTTLPEHEASAVVINNNTGALLTVRQGGANVDIAIDAGARFTVEDTSELELFRRSPEGGPEIDSLVGMQISVRYSNTEGPCPGGHQCDAAIFRLTANGVDLGRVNLNNGDDGGDRSFALTITDEMAEAIGTGVVTFALTCDPTDPEFDPVPFSGACHMPIGWVQILAPVTGESLYNACPAGSFFSLDIIVRSDQFSFEYETAEGSSMPVQTRLVTRAMDFAETINPKTGFFGEMEILQSDVDITVDAILDGGDPQRLLSETMTSGLVVLPATLPFTFGSPKFVRRKMMLNTLGQFRELQFELNATNGPVRLRKMVAAAYVDTVELNNRGV